MDVWSGGPFCGTRLLGWAMRCVGALMRVHMASLVSDSTQLHPWLGIGDNETGPILPFRL